MLAYLQSNGCNQLSQARFQIMVLSLIAENLFNFFIDTYLAFVDVNTLQSSRLVLKFWKAIHELDVL